MNVSDILDIIGRDN